MGDLISRNSLDNFFYSETSGTEEVIEDAVMKYPNMEIEYPDDCRTLCKDIIEMCRNVIRTEPMAYDVDAVVSEIKKKYCQKCRNILSVAGAEEYCKEQKCRIDDICDIVKRGGVE